MQKLIASLTTQHDWRLVLLALGICIVGVGASMRSSAQAQDARGVRRTVHVILGALIGGTTLWATHFVAILGYSPGLPISYGYVGTFASLGIALTGLTGAVFLTTYRRDWPTLALGGAMIGATLSAMHFVSMWDLSIQGTLIWDRPLAAVAVAVALTFISAAMMLTRLARYAVACMMAALGVCGMHFIAMAALTIVPDPSIVMDSALADNRLAVGVATVSSLMVLGAALLAAMNYWTHSHALHQLREAVDAMPDGMAFFDADDRLVVWNAKYGEVTPDLGPQLKVGMRFQEVASIALHLYPEAEGREEEWMQARMVAHGHLSCTLEQRLVGDQWLRIQDRRTADGGIVTVVNDITDLKRGADALAVARDAAEAANRAKSEFLANMSHEIRTPLNGVIGVAQVLAKTNLDDQQREMLELVHSSGQMLQTLLSDILDLAQVEAGRMTLRNEPMDLEKAINEAAQLYAASARDKGLQFFVEIAPEAAIWIDGDVVRIKQILTNLVSNAVKFTSTGFVSLTVAIGPTVDGAPSLRFTVEDTGIGFDAVARDRLFSRFEQADSAITRRFGGSGLGLAICRQLAEMMDGELDCESEPGGGSAFILTLPLREIAQPQAVETPPAASREVGRLRVLLADDHPTNRRVVELILAQIDVELLSVENGVEAVEAVRIQPFDVILMDMQMPVMDGLTATREIRLHESTYGLNRTPIVMLTANALPDHIASGQAAGADRHLSKPFSAPDLIAMVCDLGGGGGDCEVIAA